MNTIKDLCDLIKTGKRPIVTFGAGIEEKDEVYPETGMRGRAIRVDETDDDVVKIVFDFDEFKGHNTPLESANYWDKAGAATLTAQEAGFYKPIDDVYFDIGEDLGTLMVVESEAASALFDAFKAEGSTLTYVQWLEAKVLAFNDAKA